MAVKQEMAEIYPPEAEELSEYLPETDCGKCGFSSCLDLAEALIAGQAVPSRCPELGEERSKVLTTVLCMKKEPIPCNTMMDQAPCDLIEINSPGKTSPVLVTGNLLETIRIMREILDQSGMPCFLLPTFTHGYSVDNAVHERMFKATEVFKALTESGVREKVERVPLVIPGLAESEKNAIRRLTGWEVLVGPVSGFLAPPFLLKTRDESLLA